MDEINFVRYSKISIKEIAQSGLGPYQWSGSKPRCHLITQGNPEHIAQRLNMLISPMGLIGTTDRWMPRGFENIEEAQLHDAQCLLDKKQYGDDLKNWWLANAKPNSVTPNWDIASTCKVGGSQGLLLIEAKAHHGELKSEDHCGAGKKNLKRISENINEANTALNRILPGWNLSHENHYQLSNRIAWSWKLASIGIPVILVYLGFLKAEEMPNFLRDEQSWNTSLKSYARGVVPEDAWGVRRQMNLDQMAFKLRDTFCNFKLF